MVILIVILVLGIIGPISMAVELAFKMGGEWKVGAISMVSSTVAVGTVYLIWINNDPSHVVLATMMFLVNWGIVAFVFVTSCIKEFLISKGIGFIFFWKGKELVSMKKEEVK